MSVLSDITPDTTDWTLIYTASDAVAIGAFSVTNVGGSNASMRVGIGSSVPSDLTVIINHQIVVRNRVWA